MELDVELDALKIRYQRDEWFNEPTPKQLGKLNSLVSSALEDKNNRYAVISKMAGHTISTTHQLTRWVASVLIDTLQDESGAELVRAVENTVKAEPLL